MILGISTTKSTILVAETQGGRDYFTITRLKAVPFAVLTGEDLADLLRTLRTLLTPKSKDPAPVIALLKCSSGRFGSCLEAIKGEAMVELAATQLGLRLTKITPQSLKKTLGGAPAQKWRDRAAELFNPDDKRLHWSKAAAGAVSAAFQAAGN
jgi:hypothetical protein